MKKKIVLSDRLLALSAMVGAGNKVCDVGCDHAWVPIYLIKRGISPSVLAMDVRKGPLEQAKGHIKEYGLEKYIETRLSDGLECYKSGEADSLICAGMGGRLMISILGKDAAKTSSFKELILQPQSELQQFRHFLRSQGYLIVGENMIEEGGKFYPIIKAVYKTVNDNTAVNDEETLTLWESVSPIWREQMEDRYGPLLIRNRHPALGRYLNWEKGIYEEILLELEKQDMSGEKLVERYREVRGKLDDCLKVLNEVYQIP